MRGGAGSALSAVGTGFGPSTPLVSWTRMISSSVTSPSDDIIISPQDGGGCDEAAARNDRVVCSPPALSCLPSPLPPPRLGEPSKRRRQPRHLHVRRQMKGRRGRPHGPTPPPSCHTRCQRSAACGSSAGWTSTPTQTHEKRRCQLRQGRRWWGRQTAGGDGDVAALVIVEYEVTLPFAHTEVTTEGGQAWAVTPSTGSIR